MFNPLNYGFVVVYTIAFIATDPVLLTLMSVLATLFAVALLAPR